MTTSSSSPTRRTTLRERLYFVAVGGYLSVVMLWLLARGRLDPGVSLRRSLAVTLLRRRAKGTLDEIRPERGLCFVAPMPAGLLSDVEGASRVELLEDGRPLGPGHCPHDDVRAHGGGRYSHWGEWMYFSSSDGSDPRDNGRVYTFRESA